MIDPAALLLFAGASLLLILAPGPDILFLLAQSLANGAKAGLATACGLAAGNLVHTLAAALGVSVIFQSSALAFQALKFVGVAYLLWLAWRSLRGSGNAAQPVGAVFDRDRPNEGSGLFWRGVLMNVLNPKVALFFLAFLPQFAQPAQGEVWLQMLLLGLLFALMVLLVFGAIGLFAGRLHAPLGRLAGPNTEGLMRHLVAALFVGLAVRLAWIERAG